MSSSTFGSSMRSFPPDLPQHDSSVAVLYEVLKGEEEHCRLWTRNEMNQIADPLIDSLFVRLNMSSSSSSAIPQHRSTVSDLCELLEGEKVETRNVLRGEMDRIVNTLFERLTNKLMTNTELDRSVVGGNRAQVVDQIESPNPQSHQQSFSITQPSTSSSFNHDSHQQQQPHSNSNNEMQLNTVEMIQIKEEVEDETRIIDIEGLDEDNQSDGDGESREPGEEVKSVTTTQQMDCVKQEFKEEFDYGQEIEIKQEDDEEEDETTNNEVKLEIKEESEDTQISNIEGLAEDNRGGGGDVSRSVENAPMDTTPLHQNVQSQLIIRQSTRVSKRKQTYEPNEMNIHRDNQDNEVEEEDDYGDADGNGNEDADEDYEDPTSRPVKRSRPTTSSSAQEKLRIITLTLRCPQLDCGLMFAQNELNKHMKENHSIGPFRCMVKDCAQSFDNKPLLTNHLAQSHQHTAQWHCHKCEHHFTTYRLLSMHNIQIHQLGHFQCAFPACPFTGEYKKKMCNHYSQQHKPTRKCQQCEYESTSAYKLKRHQRVHLGTKPYKCNWPQCHYASTHRSNTIVHIRRMHLDLNPSLASNGAPLDPSDYVEVVLDLL